MGTPVFDVFMRLTGDICFRLLTMSSRDYTAVKYACCEAVDAIVEGQISTDPLPRLPPSLNKTMAWTARISPQSNSWQGSPEGQVITDKHRTSLVKRSVSRYVICFSNKMLHIYDIIPLIWS